MEYVMSIENNNKEVITYEIQWSYDDTVIHTSKFNGTDYQDIINKFFSSPESKNYIIRSTTLMPIS